MEVSKPKIKTLVDSVSVKGPFLIDRQMSSPWFLDSRKDKDALWGALYKTLIHSWGLHPLDLILFKYNYTGG